MSDNERFVAATPEEVFAVLADGWMYSGWVVGASRIRDVDKDWPAPGSDIHHSVGAWPLLIDDSTSVEECDPPRRLQLKARAWPTGAGRVVMTIEPRPGGSLVRMAETAVSGPAKLLPDAVADPVLRRRNTEALRRLAYLAERRPGQS